VPAACAGMMLTMKTLITWIATDGLWVIALAAAAWWLLRVDRPAKLPVAASALIGAVVAGLLMYLAGHLHTDPRPFVQNPGLRPYFHHSPDNGFPSDHSVAAGLAATLVLLRDRIVGALLAALAVAVAAARVAAHVHHVQDVAAGLAIGAVAALIGAWAATTLAALTARRRSASASV
jgi:membrane-associated phospholipid phosphatase